MRRKQRRHQKVVVLSKKSLYKAISWRVISILLSFTLGYFFIGEVIKTIGFTVVYSIISTGLYYLHEMWYKVARRKGWLDI
jgi:uncharacterized membrane protein